MLAPPDRVGGRRHRSDTVVPGPKWPARGINPGEMQSENRGVLQMMRRMAKLSPCLAVHLVASKEGGFFDAFRRRMSSGSLCGW